MVLLLLVLNAAAGASMSSAYVEDPLSRSDCRHRHRPDLPLLLVDLPVEEGVEDQSGAEQTGVQFLL